MESRKKIDMPTALSKSHNSKVTNVVWKSIRFEDRNRLVERETVQQWGSNEVIGRALYYLFPISPKEVWYDR